MIDPGLARTGARDLEHVPPLSNERKEVNVRSRRRRCDRENSIHRPGSGPRVYTSYVRVLSTHARARRARARARNALIFHPGNRARASTFRPILPRGYRDACRFRARKGKKDAKYKRERRDACVRDERGAGVTRSSFRSSF